MFSLQQDISLVEHNHSLYFASFILKPERIVDIDSKNIVLDLNTTEIVNVTQTVTEHIMPVWNYIVTLYLIGIGAMIIYFLVSLVRLLLFIIQENISKVMEIISYCIDIIALLLLRGADT